MEPKMTAEWKTWLAVFQGLGGALTIKALPPPTLLLPLPTQVKSFFTHTLGAGAVLTWKRESAFGRLERMGGRGALWSKKRRREQ